MALVRQFMHTDIHIETLAYIYTYINTCMHTCVPAYLLWLQKLAID